MAAIYPMLFAIARMWWFVRRPRTQGAVVAMWHQGRVLLVRSSYRRHYGLPGGFVKRGETHREAAAREVAEELSLTIAPGDLTLAWRASTFFEHRHDTTTVWEITFDERPPIHVDGREIVGAAWKTPTEAAALLLSPPIVGYLSEKRTGGRDVGSSRLGP
ncbi:MAG TPA: NUDIX domain-containing protein [Vicinamibacterales bacterium]|nr:NUDIX domain-containing protein [Vicinamibacterales bacterium]